MTGVSEVYQAQLRWKEDESNPSGVRHHNLHGDNLSSSKAEPQRVRNFYVRPAGQDLSVPEPWGIFVDGTEPIDEINFDKAGIKPLSGYDDPHLKSPGSWPPFWEFREPYYQAAPGVDVVYW